MEETESERRADDFGRHLPVPHQPALERDQAAFATRYRPNSIFLAQLIATRDYDIQAGTPRPDEALNGTNSYRAVAALPRRRVAGHLLKAER